MQKLTSPSNESIYNPLSKYVEAIENLYSSTFEIKNIDVFEKDRNSIKTYGDYRNLLIGLVSEMKVKHHSSTKQYLKEVG